MASSLLRVSAVTLLLHLQAQAQEQRCELTIDDCPSQYYLVNEDLCECECNISWTTCLVAPGLSCYFDEKGLLCSDPVDIRFLRGHYSLQSISALFFALAMLGTLFV